MRIRVTGYLSLREGLGKETAWEVEAAGFTVNDLLSRIASELGDSFQELASTSETGSHTHRITVLVNGRHCAHLPQGLDTLLADGDEVAIFPPVAGG